ncbi:uncharacterized protein LODBEIA_P35200 [Lodderomyces beijingensis]|uniref:Ribosomal RNA-processing protein 14/surfeit locus protein 6 C-terminal domain-containing protein n=1 Tax=Lodderomyces beijingensis TaxID=1775926 RepID=A0ABP0ZMB2_9ASCO
MSNSLEERLKEHSTAFDGLLSLIPAKYFYDDATQDQWQQKKQSKEEKRQNKRAKLDPESKKAADELVNSHASAKDVMENKSRQALEHRPRGERKQGTLNGQQATQKDQTRREELHINDKSEANRASNDNDDDNDDDDDDDDLMAEDAGLIFDDDGNEIEQESFEKESIRITNGNGNKKGNGKKSESLSPEEQAAKQKKLAELKEKLESKINNLREKRKAIGTKASGAPQSREQILAERKRKAELTKQQQQQQQQKRKHEELEDEENSDGSDNSDADSDMEADANEEEDKSVMFGNIAFRDGSQVTSDLSRLRNSADKKKLKGPANNDLKAHLAKLEKKKLKLSSMTPEEQAAQNKKDNWQRVISQAEGIKVKDDERLLKKAIKRKEKKKLKSEIEWRDRKQVVKDTVAARAKRREENLKARKESKHVKGKKKKQQPKLRKFTGVVNKKAGGGQKKRAGFEGSVKSKGKK